VGTLRLGSVRITESGLNPAEIRLLAEIDDLTRYCQEPSAVQEKQQRAESLAQDYWNQVATINGESPVFQPSYDVSDDLPEPGWPERDGLGDSEC